MTPLQSKLSSNLFLHVPNATSTQNSRERYLTFFITGNPGLVGYYTPFFRRLVKSLPGSVALFASSLAAFEIRGQDGGDGYDLREEEEQLLYPAAVRGIRERRDRMEVVGLGEQVEVCVARLREVVRRLQQTNSLSSSHEGSEDGEEPGYEKHSIGDHDESSVPTEERAPAKSKDGRSERRSKAPIKVILIGHSVGAWIALEMIHQLSTSSTSKPEGTIIDFSVTSAILLTPTILDLALSPTGRMAGPVMGSMLGAFVPGLAQWGAWSLGWMGKGRLRGLVAMVTGMGRRKGGERAKDIDANDGEEDTETKNGLSVTTQFLASPNGVRQALGLAAEELKMIVEDRWGEEVWGGASEEGAKSPKLFFLFAGSDHWVANETREKIMQKTSQMGAGRRHVVQVDEELEHAWCLRQNGRVADRVGTWIEESREV
jgi:pimeloyl-ACP methyl ester carboxylesterase